jgi:hypothetical protein
VKVDIVSTFVQVITCAILSMVINIWKEISKVQDTPSQSKVQDYVIF